METKATPPAAKAANSAASRTVMFMHNSVVLRSCLIPRFAGVERFGEPFLFAEIACPFPEARTPDAGRTVLAANPARGVLAQDLVEHEVLSGDHVAFETHDLGYVGNATRAVAQPGRLDDDVDRRNEHLANGPDRQGESAHGDHRLEAA